MSNNVTTVEEAAKLAATESLNTTEVELSDTESLVEPTTAQSEETTEPTPEEQEQIIKETKAAQDKYIQDSFLKEWGDISSDVNKSNKRMIDVNIQQAILNYLSEYLKTPLASMDHAFELLTQQNLHLNVIPTKHEFNSYSISIEILQTINSKSFNIKTSSNIEIS